jgi:tetratricopeptide (TPR) repeat protein
VKDIGRELNVRFVLEGSVQRRGERMRVNVQLVDTESGAHVWAERFDKPVTDFFDMQDEVVARLANQLGVELMLAEARHSERTRNPDSIDLTFQGVGWYVKGPTREHLTKAREFFERALELDPNNVQALTMIALDDFIVATQFVPDDRAERLSAAEAAATKALSLAPDRAMAHLCLATVFGVTNRAAEGIAECERALALDWNLAGAHALLGWLKIYVGHAEETEVHVQEALRLSPHDRAAFYWRNFVGTASFLLGRHEAVAAWFRQSIEANRNNPMSHFSLAAALATLGRMEEARAACKSGLAINPNFSIERLRATLTSNSPYHAERERFIEGMRMAGVPKG